MRHERRARRERGPACRVGHGENVALAHAPGRTPGANGGDVDPTVARRTAGAG